MKIFLSLLITYFLLVTEVFAQSCPTQGVFVQVLGSGGPEVQDKRASSSYLVWVNGKARVLVDSGGGSALRFGESDARFADLAVVLFSHLHIDHSADFPVLIKSSFFEGRVQDLPVFGPEGNHLLPSTEAFVQRLFSDKDGVWPYLSDHLADSGSRDYKLQTKNISFEKKNIVSVFSNNDVTIHAISVHHGPLLALAWRVQVGDKSVTFSGDMSDKLHTLTSLAANTDILIAHNAVSEGTTGVARNLHMPPSVIGSIAARAHVKKLVLSHRMLRTLGREKETLLAIRQYYKGNVAFADDLSCYSF